MKMMIRPKVWEMSDLDIVKFAKGDVSRMKFLQDRGFVDHEIDTLISLSFYLRNKIKDDVTIPDLAIPFIVKLYNEVFPDSSCHTTFSILMDWLEKENAKLFLASALYLLKHFKGSVEEKKTYVYLIPGE